MTPPIATTPWLGKLRPGPPPRLRMFCFPYAGGGIATYRQWSTRLPPDVEVCPVRFPGREMRIKEAVVDDWDTLRRTLMRELGPYLTTPYVFFGHSMGATIGYNLALSLRRAGIRLPELLVVSGRLPPNHDYSKRPEYTLPEVNDEAIVRYFTAMNSTTQMLLADQDLFRVVMPVLRGDVRLLQTMTDLSPEKLDVPILAFGGTRDASSPEDEVRDWRLFSSREFTYHSIDTGEHLFLGEKAGEVCALLSRELSRLRG